jgi:hypothetical protein
MEKTSICAACATFGISSPELSVDPACRSPHERDRLCAAHRARMTEGYCVLCARREPWISPFPESRIGCCRPCFAALTSEEEARRLDRLWAGAPAGALLLAGPESR